MTWIRFSHYFLVRGIHWSPVHSQIKINNVELRCFLSCHSEQTVDQTVERPMMWDSHHVDAIHSSMIARLKHLFSWCIGVWCLHCIDTGVPVSMWIPIIIVIFIMGITITERWSWDWDVPLPTASSARCVPSGQPIMHLMPWFPAGRARQMLINQLTQRGPSNQQGRGPGHWTTWNALDYTQ